MVALGAPTRARRLRGMEIWPCYNGLDLMVALGTIALASTLLTTDILQCSNGLLRMAARDHDLVLYECLSR